MNVKVFNSKRTLAKAAAAHAADAISRVRSTNNGKARVCCATGMSQVEFLEELTKQTQFDWERVELFHLDEYVGLPATHPASFRRYILDRLVNPAGIQEVHMLDGETNPSEVARDVGRSLASAPVDVMFLGIGENGHLAFNDPPADFETEEPYIVVKLDEACRRQQVSEGWFGSIEEVPVRAISMSVVQILKAKEIIAVVPEGRKAPAVKACLEGEISPWAPASILRTHPHTTIYLDRDSAALLSDPSHDSP